MTKSQEKAIERIKKITENTLFFNDTDYEIKTWEITENKFFVNLYLVTGLKNDEGTYASIFARDRAQFFIGKKGKVTYPINKKNGKLVRRNFDGNIMSVVIEQR